MALHFKKLDIPEVILIEPEIYGDPRGFLAEIYKLTDYQKNGIKKPFVQVNHSKSCKNVLRGLHYQIEPKAQGKLVTIIEGEIFDVAVDIREGSPTCGRWVAKTLTAEKKDMLYIPEGFAHGFCVLSETAQVIYYCTEIYSPVLERGVLWNDPELNISWPVANPTLSDRDGKMPLLSQADNSFKYDKS